jgi:hypothetical protein
VRCRGVEIVMRVVRLRRVRRVRETFIASPLTHNKTLAIPNMNNDKFCHYVPSCMSLPLPIKGRKKLRGLFLGKELEAQ